MAHPDGYSRVQISLHWIIALLILGQFLFHERIENVAEALADGQSTDITQAIPHVIGGSLVFVLVVWRLILRARRGAPELPPEGNAILDMIAKLSHWLLYALMVLVPLSGMAAWFGGVAAAAEAHGTLFFTMAALILLHIAGAVYHQWVKKDGLLRRMMKAG